MKRKRDRSNRLWMCPEMRHVADALKDSGYKEDRAVAKYLQSKLDELERDVYVNAMNLTDPGKPLTTREKSIMSMRFFKGMTHHEIAMRTGLNEQYVMNVCSTIPKKYVIGQEEFWTAGGELE